MAAPRLTLAAAAVALTLPCQPALCSSTHIAQYTTTLLTRCWQHKQAQLCGLEAAVEWRGRHSRILLPIPPRMCRCLCRAVRRGVRRCGWRRLRGLAAADGRSGLAPAGGSVRGGTRHPPRQVGCRSGTPPCSPEHRPPCRPAAVQQTVAHRGVLRREHNPAAGVQRWSTTCLSVVTAGHGTGSQRCAGCSGCCASGQTTRGCCRRWPQDLKLDDVAACSGTSVYAVWA